MPIPLSFLANTPLSVCVLVCIFQVKCVCVCLKVGVSVSVCLSVTYIFSAVSSIDEAGLDERASEILGRVPSALPLKLQFFSPHCYVV